MSGFGPFGRFDRFSSWSRVNSGGGDFFNSPIVLTDEDGIVLTDEDGIVLTYGTKRVRPIEEPAP
jgi:hypothetical protein